jgi:hypothetical protein
MNWIKSIPVFILISSGTLLAQNRPETVNNSSMMDIQLPSEAIREHRIFYVAAAKTTLELEATPKQVVISDVEVLTYANQSGDKEDAKKWIENVEKSLSDNQYQISRSASDPLFSWLSKDGLYYLMYANAGKKEAAVYFGVADKLPDVLNNTPQSDVTSESRTSNNDYQSVSPQNTQHDANISNDTPIKSSDKFPSELIGAWGNLAGAKVNWRDESTGYMLVSGVSKGYGLELKADGTFLHTTVVTSGRPNYRVFVSTSGTWSVMENQLILNPQDRHYRKWENEIIMTDEHSVPKQYTMFWMLKSNEITGKECLYIKYEQQQEQYDELCKE